MMVGFGGRGVSLLIFNFRASRGLKNGFISKV